MLDMNVTSVLRCKTSSGRLYDMSILANLDSLMRFFSVDMALNNYKFCSRSMQGNAEFG